MFGCSTSIVSSKEGAKQTPNKKIEEFCQRNNIELPVEGVEDLGMRLLMADNQAISRAFFAGEKAILKILLDTLKRVSLNQKTEAVSRGGKFTLIQLELANEMNRYYYSNLTELIIQIGSSSSSPHEFDEIVRAVLEIENLELLLPEESSRRKSFIKGGGLICGMSSLDLIEKMNLRQRFDDCSSAERVSIGSNAAESVKKELIVENITRLDTNVWGREQWIENLSLVKHHIKGVELANNVPTGLLEDPEIRKLKQECAETKNALLEVSGHLLKAVERWPDSQREGYQIVFTPIPYQKPDLLGKSHIEKIKAQIFPAIEFIYRPQHYNEPLLKKLGFERFESCSSMGDSFSERSDLTLGKRYNKRLRVVLPDGHFLLKRWNSLRQEDPSLPELKILFVSGVSDDQAFLKGLFEHDFIWSEKEEFVHDVLVHIIPTLNFIYDNPIKYLEYKQSWIALIKRGVEVLESHKEKGLMNVRSYNQLLNALSYLADVLCTAAYDGDLDVPKDLKEIPGLLRDRKNKDLSRYLERKFGSNKLSDYQFFSEWYRVFGKKADSFQIEVAKIQRLNSI